MDATELRTGEVQVAGVRTRVIEAGPDGSTEAVLFVHGNPGSAGDWRRLLSEAGKRSRAVALDIPGFGQADKPRDFDYTVDGLGRYLRDAADRLGLERVHLVLHDFGGFFGLAYALAEPERLCSITLINAGVLPRYRGHWVAWVWRTPLLGELSMRTTSRRGFGLVLRRGNPRGLPPAFVDEMWQNFDRGTRRAVLRLYRSTGRREIDGLAERTVATFSQRDIPALVIWGTRDPYVPRTYAYRQRDAFPGAEVHLLGESGHWPYADQPEAVSALVHPFLDRHVGRSPPGAARASQD